LAASLVACGPANRTPVAPSAVAAEETPTAASPGTDGDAVSGALAAKRPTRVTTTAVDGVQGRAAEIPATLTEANGTPIRGATLVLTASKNVVSARTDANGSVTFSLRIPQSWPTGLMRFTVEYAGSTTYQAASASATIDVGNTTPTPARMVTTLTVASTTAEFGTTVSVPVKLTAGAEHRPVAGVVIETRYNSNVDSAWRAATTNSAGTAVRSIPATIAPGATALIEARFAGTSTLLPSEATGTVQVVGTPPTGGGPSIAPDWTANPTLFAKGGGTGLLAVTAGTPEWRCVASANTWIVLDPRTTSLTGWGSAEFTVLRNAGNNGRTGKIYVGCRRASGRASITITQR
jgi:hypothetical protein